jgi:hypothetical protein
MLPLSLHQTRDACAHRCRSAGGELAWGALAAAMLLSGCGDTHGAGTLALGPELVVAPVELPPELAAETFFRVSGLAALPGLDTGVPGTRGPVVGMVDSGNFRVALWWPDEGRVRVHGGVGSGPGEFRSPGAIWPAEQAFVVHDTGNRRFVLVDPLDGVQGAAPGLVPNLSGGGTLLADGLFLVPADDRERDPFRFHRFEPAGADGSELPPGGLRLVDAPRPAGFPVLDSLSAARNPLYDQAGLELPPLAPVSTDVTVALGPWLLWVRQRHGDLVVLPLPAEDDASDPPGVMPLPEEILAGPLEAWTELGSQGMRERAFMAFLPGRPDAAGRQVLLPQPLSTGHPLGWLVEVDDQGALSARTVRLARGTSLGYAVRAALPLGDGRILVGHEDGLTLLAPTAGVGEREEQP